MSRHRLFTLALTVAAFGLASLASVPQSTALPPCTCTGSYQTAVQTGSGSTCGTATANLYDKTFALAQQFCGVGNVCNMAMLICNACRPCGGTVIVDGRLLHGCCAGSPVW